MEKTEQRTNSGAKGADNNNYELKWAQLGFGFIDAPRACKQKQERNRSPYQVTYSPSRLAQ